jgi:uncharacterized protein YgiM (DUF1202 family)
MPMEQQQKRPIWLLFQTKQGRTVWIESQLFQTTKQSRWKVPELKEQPEQLSVTVQTLVVEVSGQSCSSVVALRWILPFVPG